MINRWQIKKYFQILFRPISLLVIGLEIFLIFVQDYYYFTNDIQKTYELIVNNSLMFIATGLGIFVPIVFARELQKRDQKRLMVFAISACWNEARSNIHTLKTLQDNFNFESSFSLFTEDPVNNLDKILYKYQSLIKLKILISKSAYDAMLSSNTISYLENDDIYNKINTGYESLEGFMSEFVIVHSALKLRLDSFKSAGGIPITLDQKLFVINDVKNKIFKVKKELNYAINKLEEMKLSLSNEVVKSGPELKEVPREL